MCWFLKARDWIQRVLGDQLPGEDGDDLQGVLQNGVVSLDTKTTNKGPKYLI